MKINNHILMALFLCVGSTLVIWQQPVFALSTFEYDFSGTVISSIHNKSTNLNEQDKSLPYLQAGDTFFGHLTLEYDPTLEDQVPLDDHRAIYNSSGSYSIIFDNFEISSGGYSALPIDLTLSTLRLYDFTPDTSDFGSDDLYFQFASTNGPVFDSYALPYGIDFNAFEEKIIWFDILAPDISRPLEEELVTARIDSIAQVAVPEPGTALLLLSGLGIGTLASPKNSKRIVNILKGRTFM